MGGRILSMHSHAATFHIAYPRTGVRCTMKLRTA
jgi:hypothetical protein